MTVCPHCEVVTPDGARFCRSCGRPLETLPAGSGLPHDPGPSTAPRFSVSMPTVAVVAVVLAVLVATVAFLLGRDTADSTATPPTTVLSGETAIEDAPTGYGPEIEANFVETCTDQGGEDLQDVCQCAYESFEREIPFERFQEVDDRLDDDADAALPDDFLALYTDCVVAFGGG